MSATTTEAKTTTRPRRGRKVVTDTTPETTTEEWVMENGKPVRKEEAKVQEEVKALKAPKAPKEEAKAPVVKKPRVKTPTEVGGFEVLREFPKDCVGQKVRQAIKAGSQSYEAIQE